MNEIQIKLVQMLLDIQNIKDDLNDVISIINRIDDQLKVVDN